MRKRAYRSVAFKSVDVQEVISRLAVGRVQVGIDLAKDEFLVCLQDSAGTQQRPWRVRQPGEIKAFVERLAVLSRERPLTVAMESTGTYGDCLRQELTDAGLVPHRVSAKGK